MMTYLIGRCIPLYGVSTEILHATSADAQTLLLQSIGGDLNKTSIFALGVFPNMIASLVMQMYMSVKSSESKAEISPKVTSMITLILTVIIALYQAFIRIREMYFVNPLPEVFVKSIAGAELVTGALIILWLTERNKKYGIGGQSLLIFINILDTLMSTLSGHSWQELATPLCISLVLVVLMVFMENSEIRIPVQRISIHNIFADKNYLAIKLNPIGVMPLMFAMAFFMLPQLIVRGLLILFPNSTTLIWWMDNLVLTKQPGIIVYMIIVYLLTVIFSFIIINPGEHAESFLKSGDSIVNVPAGEATKKYITKVMLSLGMVSATVMCLCVGVPLELQIHSQMDASLSMLPTTVMMLTGIWSTLFQEYQAVRSFDKYDTFI